jgi:hypothetical protein
MKHLTEEELILQHYGEANESALLSHIKECSQCRIRLEQLDASLRQLRVPAVPDLEEGYEAQVWLKLRDQLPEKKANSWAFLLRPRNWAMAGAMAVLMIGAFLAGHFWTGGRGTNKTPNIAQNNPAKVDRLVALAVGNHLEKSQILLIELMTEPAEDKADFSATQEQARDLLDANRLYRISAERGKDPAVQHTLDDLERVLVEIANSPSDLKAGDVQRLQKLVESEGLLFKVRVVGSRIRQQNNPPPAKQLGTKL